MAGRQRQLVFLTRAARRRNRPDGIAFHPDPRSVGGMSAHWLDRGRRVTLCDHYRVDTEARGNLPPVDLLSGNR
jgi:hypothetical protein